MPGSYTRLYVHLTWSTWDRLPLITAPIGARVQAALEQKCRELGCVPLATGGVADHVHMLVQIRPTITVADLVQELKGSSSHLVTHSILPGEFFRWQGGYGALTLGPGDVQDIERYNARQKEHHWQGETCAEWEPAAGDSGDRG